MELHCHSVYSRGSKIPWEGLSRPKEIVKAVKRAGLDGFSLTDHRVTEGLPEAARYARKHGLVFIPGVEVQTLDGHVIALGITEPVKNFRSLEETLDEIRSQGAVSVAPHPFDIKGEGLRHKAGKVDAIEVFNSLNLDKLSNFAARRVAEKTGKPAVCGSDAHSLEMIGASVNEAEASDAEEFLRAVKKGRVSVSGSYIPTPVVISWARERLRLSYGDVLKYVRKNYGFPKNLLAEYMLKKFVASESPFWKVLASVGLNISRIYGSFKILSYFI